MPEDDAGLRAGGGGREARDLAPLLGVRELGEAEVEDLHPAVVGDEDVLGLQVPVDDPLLVRGGEAVDDLEGVVDRLARRELAAGEDGAEGLAFEELLDDVGRAVVLADVVDGGDVGVVEDAGGFGLLLEAAQAIGVGGEGGGEDLDRDVAAEARVLGAVDLPHAAGADGGEDLVGAEAGAGGEGHWVGGILVAGGLEKSPPRRDPSPPSGGEGIPASGSVTPPPGMRRVLFRGADSPVQLAEGESEHRAELRHLASDGAKLPCGLLAKALETFRDHADLRSQPFGDDVEMTLDLFDGLAVHRYLLVASVPPGEGILWKSELPGAFHQEKIGAALHRGVDDGLFVSCDGECIDPDDAGEVRGARRRIGVRRPVSRSTRSRLAGTSDQRVARTPFPSAVQRYTMSCGVSAVTVGDRRRRTGRAGTRRGLPGREAARRRVRRIPCARPRR